MPPTMISPSLWCFLPINDVHPSTKALNVRWLWEAIPASPASLQNFEITHLPTLTPDAFESRAEEWEADPGLLVFNSSCGFYSGSARVFYPLESLMGTVKYCGVKTEICDEDWDASKLASEALFSSILVKWHVSSYTRKCCYLRTTHTGTLRDRLQMNTFGLC